MTAPLPKPQGTPLRLADDFAFTAEHTSAPVKFSFTRAVLAGPPGQ
jgi:hypothetical protein